MLPIISAMTARGLRLGMAVTVAAMSMMTGCSDSGDDGASSRVATLASADAPKAAASADVDDQRPLVRLDATDEDREAMYKTWADCMVEKGGPRYKDYRFYAKGDVPNDPSAKDVLAACISLQPEGFIERYKRQDLSGFKDANRRMYKCAQDKGYKLTAPDPETGQFGLTEITSLGDRGSEGIRECERQAYADRL